MSDARNIQIDLASPAPTYRDILLGWTIEVDPDSRGQFRVVDHARPATVLARGTLPHCERVRLARLRKERPPRALRVELPTLGGKQFWTDVFVHCRYRIQEHVSSEWCRLLSPRDRSLIYGDYRDCRVALEALRIEQALVARSRHAVVLLHGLIRAKDSMAALDRALNDAGYEVINVNYPSTRRPIEEHAEQVALVLSRLRGIHTLSFITHSMGGMVVREMLGRPRGEDDWRDRMDAHRLLMICPPSRGSSVAVRWKDSRLARAIEGPSLLELTPEAAQQIPAPSCQFAIIAGSRDRTVRVWEALLDGAEYIRVMNVEHTFSMIHPDVVASAVRYIDGGSLYEPVNMPEKHTPLRDLRKRFDAALDSQRARLRDTLEHHVLRVDDLLDQRQHAMANTGLALRRQFDKEVRDRLVSVQLDLEHLRGTPEADGTLLARYQEQASSLMESLATTLDQTEGDALTDLEGIARDIQGKLRAIVDETSGRLDKAADRVHAELHHDESEGRERLAAIVDEATEALHAPSDVHLALATNLGRRRIVRSAKSAMRELKVAQTQAFTALEQLDGDARVAIGLTKGPAPEDAATPTMDTIEARTQAVREYLGKRLEQSREELRGRLSEELKNVALAPALRGTMPGLADFDAVARNIIDSLHRNAARQMEREVSATLLRLRLPLALAPRREDRPGLIQRALERLDPVADEAAMRLADRVEQARKLARSELDDLVQAARDGLFGHPRTAPPQEPADPEGGS